MTIFAEVTTDILSECWCRSKELVIFFRQGTVPRCRNMKCSLKAEVLCTYAQRINICLKETDVFFFFYWTLKSNCNFRTQIPVINYKRKFIETFFLCESYSWSLHKNEWKAGKSGRVNTKAPELQKIQKLQHSETLASFRFLAMCVDIRLFVRRVCSLWTASCVS